MVLKKPKDKIRGYTGLHNLICFYRKDMQSQSPLKGNSIKYQKSTLTSHQNKH